MATGDILDPRLESGRDSHACDTLGPAYVAWIEHTATRLALYPGSSEPPSAPIRGPTQIPSGQRWRLLATFNGGFKANSGAGGMVVNGVVEEPLRPGMGTIVGYRDGTVAILNWLGRTNPGTLVVARQNLPPLVWNGRPRLTPPSPHSGESPSEAALRSGAPVSASPAGAISSTPPATTKRRHRSQASSCGSARTAPSNSTSTPNGRASSPTSDAEAATQ